MMVHTGPTRNDLFTLAFAAAKSPFDGFRHRNALR